MSTAFFVVFWGGGLYLFIFFPDQTAANDASASSAAASLVRSSWHLSLTRFDSRFSEWTRITLYSCARLGQVWNRPFVAIFPALAQEDDVPDINSVCKTLNGSVLLLGGEKSC